MCFHLVFSYLKVIKNLCKCYNFKLKIQGLPDSRLSFCEITFMYIFFFIYRLAPELETIFNPTQIGLGGTTISETAKTLPEFWPDTTTTTTIPQECITPYQYLSICNEQNDCV